MDETKTSVQAVTAWRSENRMVDPKPPVAKLSYRERFKELLAECGHLVLWVYFGIFGLVLMGFALAIKFGFAAADGAAEPAADTWGAILATLGAAYVATKLTQPLRIAATLVITPALVALLRRVRKPAPPVEAPSPATSAESASLESTEMSSASRESLEPAEASKP